MERQPDLQQQDKQDQQQPDLEQQNEEHIIFLFA
jgi:hypothetical protein